MVIDGCDALLTHEDFDYDAQRTQRLGAQRILAHLLAVSGFLLLRKDRPDWPRPFKLPKIWIPIAWFMTILVAFLLVVGAGAPHLNGYGTWTDFAIGVGLQHRLGDLLAHQGSEGVHLRGTIEGDGRDLIGDLIEQGFV